MIDTAVSNFAGRLAESVADADSRLRTLDLLLARSADASRLRHERMMRMFDDMGIHDKRDNTTRPDAYGEQEVFS